MQAGNTTFVDAAGALVWYHPNRVKEPSLALDHWLKQPGIAHYLHYLPDQPNVDRAELPPFSWLI